MRSLNAIPPVSGTLRRIAHAVTLITALAVLSSPAACAAQPAAGQSMPATTHDLAALPTPRWALDLSGTWKLSSYVITDEEGDPRHAEGLTAGYAEPDFDATAWQSTPVPLRWPRVDQWRQGAF